MTMRIVCFILTLSTISLASTQAPVQYVPVGNKVTISCDGYDDRSNAIWLHRNDSNKVTTIVREMSGLIFKTRHLPTRIKTIKDFSLQISPFTESDKGTYVCRVCRLSSCTDGKLITLLPQFDTVSIAISGDLFSFRCLYTLTQKAKWRFKAFGEHTANSLNSKFTDRNVLIISNVQENDAGNYSYWDEKYTGQQQRVCSLKLCVLIVNAEKLMDSPQKCTLYCDTDIHKNEKGLTVVKTEKFNISIIGSINKPKSLLMCSSGVKTHTFNPENATATAQSNTTSTADNSSNSPAATLIIMCFLFIVIALCILLCIVRKRAERRCRSANGHTQGEIDSQVIYSTVQVGRRKQQNTITSDTCEYSQIVINKII